ncbi:hypothetical protein H2200_012768 [Cladophialophora chaetospira]|uniref:Uncharacterized protein n=1 Tax=Cladophialophora chaetospira TaxID=386627 RepID=A0AA38WWR8_9EURO|nr:hypothetical protein H2200_012768 [Cladophialophora chaetospira]
MAKRNPFGPYIPREDDPDSDTHSLIGSMRSFKLSEPASSNPVSTVPRHVNPFLPTSHKDQEENPARITPGVSQTLTDDNIDVYRQLFHHLSLSEIQACLCNATHPRQSATADFHCPGCELDEQRKIEVARTPFLTVVSHALLERISEDKTSTVIILNLDEAVENVAPPCTIREAIIQVSKKWLNQHGFNRGFRELLQAASLPPSADWAVLRLLMNVSDDRLIAQYFVDFVWLLAQGHLRSSATFCILLEVVEQSIPQNRQSPPGMLLAYQAMTFLLQLSPVINYTERIRALFNALPTEIPSNSGYLAGARIAVENLLKGNRHQIPRFYLRNGYRWWALPAEYYDTPNSDENPWKRYEHSTRIVGKDRGWFRLDHDNLILVNTASKATESQVVVLHIDQVRTFDPDGHGWYMLIENFDGGESNGRSFAISDGVFNEIEAWTGRALMRRCPYSIVWPVFNFREQ